MRTHFSRSEWEQITKRVKQAGYRFSEKWKCLVCGHRFRACIEHTVEDNHQIIDQVKAREAS